MRCNHCNTSMVLIREEASSRSVVRWHKCPTCGSAHMLSEPNYQEMATPLTLLGQQSPEFRSARVHTQSSAYSGPEERRLMRRV